MGYTKFDRKNIQRIIFLSDIHLGVKNASIEWLENILGYFNDFFIPLIKKYQTKDKCALVIAGDFFDNRQSIDINVLNKGIDIIESLSKIIEIFLIIGNHDIYKKKDVDITSLRVFTNIPNVNVLYEPSILCISGDKQLGLIPWVGDAKEETKLLTNFNKENIDIAVLHSDICGLIYDNGREIVDGVNTASFNGIKIYSGHIHKRQASDKVTYLGSPYQMRRSDIGNIKGVYSLQITDSGQLIEFFDENTYSPKFLRLYLDKILEMTCEELGNIVHNNYVDIAIKQNCINKINVSKIIDLADEYSTKKIEIILDKSNTDTIEDNIEKSNDMTIEEIFITKIKNMSDLSQNEIETLETMNKNYLQQATSQLNLNV